MKPLAPNTLIQNRYLVVQLIGKGGMGEVYLAVDQRLGSAVALKRTFFSDDEVLRNAFEREAKMLARLRHPALTKVSDHFAEDEKQYLVMEHISGDDLATRLEQNKKPYPVSWVLFWADQLLDALSYLHSQEPPIIHRDIKPQNLKLTNENHIILLDFGLAKNSTGETRFSTSGSVVAYTPHYASMEQIRGTGTTAKSDIYSLSATLYQLLTDSVPADALSRADNLLNSMPDPLKPLSEVNPEVSVPVSNVIMKGLNLSSEQRFPNAREMQMALRESYSQVQQGMSAQTVAFKTDEIGQGPVASQPNLKTEAFPGSLPSQPIGEKTEVIPIEIGEKTEIIPPDLGFKTQISPIDLAPPPTENGEKISSASNVEATLPFVTPLVFDQTQDYQSNGEKTEVMPIDIPTPIDEKTEVIPVDISSPLFEKTEAFPIENPLTTQENFVTSKSDNFSPEVTVPLVVYDGSVSEVPSQATTNFVSFPPTDPNTESFRVPPEPVSETIAPVIPEPKKKSAGSGKMFLVIGIILGLGVLGIAGTGIGLYVMKPEIFGISDPTPTTKPTPEKTQETTTTPTVTPSPESTSEVNSVNSNSEVPIVNSGDANSTKTPEIVKEKTPGLGDKDKTPVPTPTKPITNPTAPIKTPPIKTPPPKTPTPKPTVCRTCPLQ